MIHILSGPVGTGKSTALRNWAKDRNDLGGVLSYADQNLRQLESLTSKEVLPFEVPASFQGATIDVGRFRFDKQAFTKATALIDADYKNAEVNCLVIDEIGKLELKGLGFAAVLKSLLESSSNKTIILVVRDYLVDEVVSYFGISGHQVLSKDALSQISY